MAPWPSASPPPWALPSASNAAKPPPSPPSTPKSTRSAGPSRTPVPPPSTSSGASRRSATSTPRSRPKQHARSLRIKQQVVALALRLYDEGHRQPSPSRSLRRRALLPETGTVLTHCNAGALAACGFGSALGVIRAAVEQGKTIDVFADETRPFNQGTRLTAWELTKDNIPTTLICDNMAGYFMSKGRIQAVIVGADRIAANGDTANKIGTYSVAILAREHGVPFYVAAPFNTIDLATASGSLIPIEERPAREVTHVNGVQVTPTGVSIANPALRRHAPPAAKYITAIITERGVLRAPFEASIHAMATEQELQKAQPAELTTA